jgi:hypothetical protein
MREAGFKKRSEVDRRLDSLVGPSGRLRDASRASIVGLLRMFNLCDIGPSRGQGAAGVEGGDGEQGAPSLFKPPSEPPAMTPRQRARMADLSLLLDVILKTSSATVKREFVACGVLNQLQQVGGCFWGVDVHLLLVAYSRCTPNCSVPEN